MGALSIWHWLVVLIVVVVVFGSGRLRNLGTDLGEAIQGFKKAMQGGEKPNNTAGDAKLSDATKDSASHERRDG